MTSLMPIVEFEKTVRDENNTNTQDREIRYVFVVPEPFRIVYDWDETRVDSAIDRLTLSPNFIKYVKESKKIIIDNFDELEDMAERYK